MRNLMNKSLAQNGLMMTALFAFITSSAIAATSAATNTTNKKVVSSKGIIVAQNSTSTSAPMTFEQELEAARKAGAAGVGASSTSTAGASAGAAATSKATKPEAPKAEAEKSPFSLAYEVEAAANWNFSKVSEDNKSAVVEQTFVPAYKFKGGQSLSAFVIHDFDRLNPTASDFKDARLTLGSLTKWKTKIATISPNLHLVAPLSKQSQKEDVDAVVGTGLSFASNPETFGAIFSVNYEFRMYRRLLRDQAGNPDADKRYLHAFNNYLIPSITLGDWTIAMTMVQSNRWAVNGDATGLFQNVEEISYAVNPKLYFSLRHTFSAALFNDDGVMNNRLVDDDGSQFGIVMGLSF